MKNILYLSLILLGFNASSQNQLLFVGSYSATGSEGIYVFNFNSETGELELASTTNGEVLDPGFLIISANGQYLYAGTDAKIPDESFVSAYKIDKAKGTIQFLNKQPSGGKNAINLSISPNGKHLLAVNYFGATVSVLPIATDGSLLPHTQLIQLSGNSIQPNRQTESHPHAAVFSPNGKQLFVPDLGADKIWVYNVDESSNQPLTSANPAFILVRPGTGPRHMVFHPNGQFAYVVQELSGSVASYSYKNGTLQFLAQDFMVDTSVVMSMDFSAADIHFSPDGRLLYVSERISNSITVFSVNQYNGQLSLYSSSETGGETPRNFCIDQTGRWAIVANQTTGNIVVFSRDENEGILTPTEYSVSVPQPTCVVLLQK